MDAGGSLRQSDGFHLVEKSVWTENVVELKPSEILPFLSCAKFIYRQQLNVASPVEFIDDVAADEAGGSGDDRGFARFARFFHIREAIEEAS